MSEKTRRERELEDRIRDLEAEVARLRACGFGPADGPAVEAPPEFRETFVFAEETVGAYFQTFRADPTEGTVEIAGERYLLVRASALSHGFLSAIRELYDDRGDVEALHIGKTLLFDMAHVIGINDARNFHEKMGLTDPLAKLSAGPVHFSYSGWAFVELLPGCNPSPDDEFFFRYRHPYSFESDSWLRVGEKTDYTVCVMNAGYSAGWCEESFGIALAAAEISCKARGDEHCEFVMAPPHRLREHVERALSSATEAERRRAIYDIPTLFERKHVEERLHAALARAEAANASQRLFLANVSHEIRTPLTGILGMTNVLLKKPLDPEQRRDIETIHQSGQVLLDILNDILDLSKIEAGMLAIVPEACDVRAVLMAVAAMLESRVAEQGLSLDIEVAESVPAFVMLDAQRLRQIVLNLTGNAVKFTDEGEIVVRAEWRAPETLRVEVVDTGIGLDEDDLLRLFEPFTQADASDTRSHGGTGLGLNIVQRLVRLMGGHIDARNRSDGGSVFSFEVPAPRAEEEAIQTGDQAASSALFDARVLLVEDDQIARLVEKRLLEDLGCQVDVAAHGGEAVAAVGGTAYDLVLMDCQMPVMDGYEASARIRQLEGPDQHTPIVAMTAGALPGLGQRCAAAGMDGFVGKPIDPHRLLAELSRWLEPRTSG